MVDGGNVYLYNGRVACAACRREANRQSGLRAWDAVLDAYGRVCECCGETNPLFLSVDHINGDGSLERQLRRGGTSTYKFIRASGFPDTYRLLCFNCNCGRARNGGICPHVATDETP